MANRSRLSMISISSPVPGSFISDDTLMPVVDEAPSGESWLCVIGDALRDDEHVHDSAKDLQLKVAYTNEPKIPDEIPSGCVLAFIVSDFEDPLFDRLWNKVRALRTSRVRLTIEACDIIHGVFQFRQLLRILGPPCLFYCAAAKVPLPLSRRPIYSLHMSGLTICFMGFRSNEKKEMDLLVTRVRYMGADVRTDISEVSYVIAIDVSSSRYEKAVALGKSIMSPNWVHACWEKRHDPNIRATDDDLLQLSLPPFTELTVSFCGFSDDDRQQMENFCEINGGTCVAYGETCTHVVCSDDLASDPDNLPQGAVAVKTDWFWESIQIRACSNVNLHLFQAKSLATPCRSPSYLSVRHVASPSPRMRHKQTPTFVFHPPSQPSPISRTTSLSTCAASTPPSYIDAVGEQAVSEVADSPAAAKLQKKLAERRNKCIELQETEINYVAILNYIVKNFVDPLELPDQRGGAILNPEEVKEIFYPLPQLAALHQNMLTDLQSRFSATTITDSTSFGDILLSHVDEMIHIYPRFINFYEARQECVLQKSKTHPRFTAFMQLRYSEAAQLRGPFSKQKLTELLITPVQRMPRYLLLLEGIIKLTADDHTDKQQLTEALAGFKAAAQRINDDKRIAEDRMKILNLPNLVEGLPPTAVASSRTIVDLEANLVLVEASEGENLEIPVCLIIFNDSIEITKRRVDSVSMDDFNSTGTPRTSGKRILRHIDFILLAEIKRILRFYTDKEDTSGDLFGMALGGGSVCSTSQSSSVSQTSAARPQQDQWIVFRVLNRQNMPAAVQASNIISTLVKTREGVLPTDPKLFVQPVPCSKLPFYEEAADHHTANGLTKAIKGARSKARRVTRVFSQQFHRLENKHSATNISSCSSK